MTDKARKTAEAQLHELTDRVSELDSARSALSMAKKKLENDIELLQVSPDTDHFIFTVQFVLS